MSLDLDINLKEVYQANRRIEDALNRRFEKDAEMYISNQDIALIKEWLANGDYELMYSKYAAENYHPDVFFRTILRNAWLIKEMKPEQFSKTIRPILKKVQPEYSKKLLKEVAENRLDVPQAFRENLLGFYARSIDPLEAEDMILNGSSIGLKRLKVLVQRVLGQYAGTPLFVTKFNGFLQEYPALGSDENILTGIVVEEERVRKHLEIIMNQIDKFDHPPRYFLAALGKGKLLAFDLVYEKASNAVKRVARQSKGVRDNALYEKMKEWLKQLRTNTEQIFSDKKFVDEWSNIFEQLTNFYEEIYKINKFQAGNIIRYCFSRIRNPEFKNRIIKYFEYIEYHEAFEEDINGLTVRKKYNEFNDVGGLFESLNNTYVTDVKRLDYLAFTFSKMKKLEQHFDLLFPQINLDDPTHDQFLYQLLANFSNRNIWKKAIENARSNPELDKLVYRVICQMVPQETAVKTYMHRNHFEKYSELYGI